MRDLRAGALAAGAVYLLWRLLFTGEGAHPVMFFLLLAAEVFGLVRFWMEQSLLGSPRPVTRSPELGVAPDADVVVVVTDEPESEVRAALLSARLVRGYREIRIVDRDDRPEIRALADRLGITRVKGGWQADLGELVDAAVDAGESLYTLLVPADVVVMPDALEVAAPAFDQPDVAVAVCRVEHTNASREIHYGGYGEELLRDTLMIDRLDREGALPWWPGMAVVRRSALLEAGGISNGRQSFSLATGVRLQAAGWRITDVPVVTARRLAPWTDDRHLHRWARELHERLAVLVDPDVKVRHEHSTRLSRRVYRTADVLVGRSIQRLVLIGILFASLYTSSLPLVAPPLVLAVLWGAWMASSVLARRQAASPGIFVPWIVNDLRLLTTDLAVAWRALRGLPPKAELIDAAPGRRLRSVLLIGLEIGLVATLAVFGTGIVRPAGGDLATLVGLGAAGWLFAMTLRARSALKFTQRRQNFRAEDRLEVVMSDLDLRAVGLSPFGIDVVTSTPVREGQRVRAVIALPQADSTDLHLPCLTTVKRVSRVGRHHFAYLRFAHMPDETVDRITEYCAVVSGHTALRDGGRVPDGGASN